jgi:hypothetical protein
MKALFLSILAISLVSCAGSSELLTDDGKKVELFNSKPGAECSVVGKVVGETDKGSVDLARNHARNLAAKLRANAIFVNEEVSNGAKIQAFATAYQCE